MDEQIPDIEIVRNDSRSCNAIWSDTILTFWIGTTDDELLERLEQDLVKMRQKLSGEYVILAIIVDSERTPPSQQARKRLAEIVKARPAREIATATVFESQGFQATVSRGVATELDISTSRQNHKVFRDIPKAAAWLAEQLGRDAKWGMQLTDQATRQRQTLKIER